MVRSESKELGVSMVKVLPGLIKESSRSLDLRNSASIAEALAVCPITLQLGQLKPRGFSLPVQVAISSPTTCKCLIRNNKVHHLLPRPVFPLRFSVSRWWLIHTHPRSLCCGAGSHLVLLLLSPDCYLVNICPQCFP